MRWFYYSLKTWLAKNWSWLTVVLLAVGFFVMASSYNYLAQKSDFIKWSSPDETANYFLTARYARTGELAYTEPDNLYAQGIIMPRSFRSDGALVKPVSFLGLILIYGQIAGLLGVAVIPYLTPAFAALGLIFFYLIVARLFKQDTAIIATCLLASFPVYIYFSARSMFHNILFIVLWLAGLFFTLKMTDTPATFPRDNDRYDRRGYFYGWLTASLAGYLTGLAATVRSSEMLWLLPVLGLLWLVNFYRLGLLKLIIFIFFFAVAFLPIIKWNMILYGSPTGSGYPKMDQSIDGLKIGSAQLAKSAIVIDKNKISSSLATLNTSIFSFGFNVAHSEKMFYHYVVNMFTWLTLLAAIGFIFLVFKFKGNRKNDLIYTLCLLILSSILILYYGSWIFYDNPDQNSYTLGNSYTRYWLPIYLGAIPLAALAIVKISAWVKHRALIWGVRTLAVVLIMFSSAYFVLYGSDEGLAYGLTRQLESATEFKQITTATPTNSIIITRYHDKLLFPDRRVIVGLFNDPVMNRQYANLAEHAPVYYYNFTLSDKDFNYLNVGKLKEAGLTLQKITPITKDFTLYKLNKINQ